MCCFVAWLVGVLIRQAFGRDGGKSGYIRRRVSLVFSVLRSCAINPSSSRASSHQTIHTSKTLKHAHMENMLSCLLLHWGGGNLIQDSSY